VRRLPLVPALFPALVLALLLPLAACGGDGDGDGETTLTVYAAASLTAPFKDIAKQFEADHEGVRVALSFGGSSDLVSQIQQGAPADVFASADTANMDKLTDDGLVDGVWEFATNTLEIATPPDDPAGVSSFQDLASKGLQLVVCAPEVPCGAATQKMAQQLGVTLSPVSEEQSVTDVLAKVTSGEADAGVVYVTDVIAAGDDVRGVPFPESDQVVNTYPIATINDADHGPLAQDFVDLVTGATGEKILRDAGFGTP
jgi:molybdate transport system substrate-binding protein